MTVNICTNQWKLRNWRKGMRRIKIISNPYKKEIKYGETINCYYSFEDDKHVITIMSEDNTVLHSIVKLY